MPSRDGEDRPPSGQRRWVDVSGSGSCARRGHLPAKYRPAAAMAWSEHRRAFRPPVRCLGRENRAFHFSNCAGGGWWQPRGRRGDPLPRLSHGSRPAKALGARPRPGCSALLVADDPEYGCQGEMTLPTRFAPHAGGPLPMQRERGRTADATTPCATMASTLCVRDDRDHRSRLYKGRGRGGSVGAENRRRLHYSSTTRP